MLGREVKWAAAATVGQSQASQTRLEGPGPTGRIQGPWPQSTGRLALRAQQMGVGSPHHPAEVIVSGQGAPTHCFVGREVVLLTKSGALGYLPSKVSVFEEEDRR